MKKNDKKSVMAFFKNRRFKYGSLAVTLTVCFIALIIFANAIITSIFTKYNVYSDLTGSSIYTLSDEAKDYLQYLNNDIEIKFAVPLDTIASSSMLTMVYRCALDYQDATKDMEHKITVSEFDAYLYPKEFEVYKQLISGEWSNTNVIIESPNAVPLVYTLNAFFSSSDSEYVGFNGERKFMSAFLQLAGIERPIVCFTTGHGETVGEQVFDSYGNYIGYSLPDGAKYADFYQLFDDIGFEIRWVNLLKDDIPEECRLLVILDPQKDFIGKGLDSTSGISEIDKLATYMSKQVCGSVMVFKGPTGTEFPILDEYLEEWNIKIDSTMVVSESAENSMSTDNLKFSVQYSTEGPFSSVNEKYKDLRTVFENAAPITILPDYSEYAEVTCNPAFTTSAYASATSSITDTTQSGTFNLMTVSQKTSYKDNEDITYFLMACGSPDILNYVGSQSFANREIINILINRLQLKKMPVDLDYKKFDDYSLPSITSQAVTVWTVILAAVMPAAVLVVGCVIVIRRKRR